MIPTIPGYITFIVIATNLIIAVALWRVLCLAATRTDLPPKAQRAVRIGSALFLGAWLGADLLLASAPSSLSGRDRSLINPLIPILNIVPIAIALLSLWRSSSLRRVVSAVPLPTVHGLQVYRAIGFTFLVLLALGQIPAHFALPAGWGDITIGLAAPLVALALARGVPGAGTLAVSWNVFGLLDLAVAVGMGTGLLSPILIGTRVPPAAALGVFPMILVPTFAVPVSVLLHLTGLVRLRGYRSTPNPLARPVAKAHARF